MHHVLTRLAIATIGYIICALKRQQSLNFHVNMQFSFASNIATVLTLTYN